MRNIELGLTHIWEKEYFKKDCRYFFLYNYSFFKLLSKEEILEANRHVFHEGKVVFAIAGSNNSDNEHKMYLYFENATRYIYIQSNIRNLEPIRLKKISTSFEELFENIDPGNVLIEKNNQAFWSWFEIVFHSYFSDIEENVPTGVLPRFDLRLYFKNNFRKVFLSDHKEFNKTDLIKFFDEAGINELFFENLFEFSPYIEEIKNLIQIANSYFGEIVFYAVFFNPSGFWGIGNYKFLDNDQKEQLIKYGLINE